MRLPTVCLVAALASTLAMGCSKTSTTEAASSYGEPIGLRIAAGADAGVELEVAVAATKGKDLTSAVNQLASAFHGASQACPRLSAVAPDASPHLVMSVRGGAMKAPAAMPDDPVMACMVKALDGKTILPPDSEPVDLIAQFRARRAGT